MDETDAVRAKPAPEDSNVLPTYTSDGINIDGTLTSLGHVTTVSSEVLFSWCWCNVYLLLFNTDGRYNALREDLEADARDFEAPTWSLTVDQQYFTTFSKDVSKRQDVIHGRRCGFIFMIVNSEVSTQDCIHEFDNTDSSKQTYDHRDRTNPDRDKSRADVKAGLGRLRAGGARDPAAGRDSDGKALPTGGKPATDSPVLPQPP